MMQQIQYKLPEIDRDATEDAVKEVLEKYRTYLLQLNLDRTPAVTASYTITPNSGSLPSSSTENAAVANADYERERTKFVEWVIRAVNRLPFLERSIIVTRYFNEDLLYDYEVYRELNISERKYYRTKPNALYRFALALKVEVYKEEEAEAI